MNYAQPVQKLGQGIPTAAMWNNVADICNAVRTLCLGPGLTGAITGSGIRLDASVTPNTSFPFGDRWCFGLELGTDSSDPDNIIPKVTVWNPVVERAGMLVSPWFQSGDIGDVPAKTSFEASLTAAKWAKDGTDARTIVYMLYDTDDNTISIDGSGDNTVFGTLPTDDGGGALEPLRYYRKPLYILQANYDSEADTVSNPRMYIDLIHGAYTPNIFA